MGYPREADVPGKHRPIHEQRIYICRDFFHKTFDESNKFIELLLTSEKSTPFSSSTYMQGQNPFETRDQKEC
jgi:hypothetical protein